MKEAILQINVQKFGSVVSRLGLDRMVDVLTAKVAPRVGDAVVVKALSESVTYGNIETPSGRLAKIAAGDIIVGALGRRRALKGFVGEMPAVLRPGDRLHLLNMGGVIGVCKGHHSSFSDAIEVEVIGSVVKNGKIANIADGALPTADQLTVDAPVIVVAGTCMNSGKTVAATELIKQAAKAGLRVAGAKISGIACLRDTLNMQDNGAFATSSFLDCGLPSTVDHQDLASVAKAILNHLDSFSPDLIVVELGDGIVGGYSVDDVLADASIRNALSSLVFCAADYVGVIGGAQVLGALGIDIDVVAGSVTDAQMGEDYIRQNLGLEAGNARRDGQRLFDLAFGKVPAAAVA